MSASAASQSKPALSYSDQTGLLILGNGLSRAVRFLGGIALPYVMLQEEYGVYLQIWVIYSILEQCLRLGYSEALVYFYPRYEGRARAGMVWQCAAVLGLLGGLFAAGLWMGSPAAAAWFGTPRLQGDLRLFAVYAVLAFPPLYLNSLLLSAGRARTVARLAVLFTALDTTAVIVPAVAGLGLTGVLAALAGTAALRFGLCILLTARTVGWGWAGRDTAMALLRFSLPLGLPKFLGVVGAHLDRLIIGAYLSAEAFAVYGRGATRLPFLPIVASSAMSVAQVGLAKAWRDRDVRAFLDLWHESIRKVALCILPVFAGMLVFGAPLYRAVFPPEYAEGARVFLAFLFLLPLQLTATTHVMVLLGRPQVVTWVGVGLNAVALGATWAAVHWAMPVMGLVAPAAAMALVHWLGFLLMIRLTAGALGVGVGRVFPWAELLRIGRWCAAAGLAGSAVRWGLAGPAAVGLALGATVFGAVFLYGLYGGGLLTADDRELVDRWLRSILQRRARAAAAAPSQAIPGQVPSPGADSVEVAA